jgi:hypothetical protein
MTLQPAGPAPYTSAISLITALDAFRDRGLGTPITADVLIRAGVQESIAPRTVHSMKLLDLLTEDGKPTEQFEDLRTARGDDEYHARLQAWLRGVYADVLKYTDPSSDTQARVAEAFRTYTPAGQRRPMALLLIGLWRYAGLPVPESDEQDPAASRPRHVVKKKRTARKTVPPPMTQQIDADGSQGLPPGLVGLLRQIPRDGASWTSVRREEFMNAFAAVLDFSVPVNDEPVIDEIADEQRMDSS